MSEDLTKEKIVEALRKVNDPELGRDLVSLGMVKSVAVETGRVGVDLELSKSDEQIRTRLRNAVMEALSFVTKVKPVEVTFSAPAQQSFSPQKQAIPGIRHLVAVSSGKGGVGKTTVAVNLAVSLKQLGYRVGLMDGDIYGPNVPMMLGVEPGTRPLAQGERILPLEVQGLKMISMGLLVPADQPMVWRGPMLHSAVTQFLQKVEWGELDYLIIDLPPGTGDVQLSLVQTVPLSGAVIVTTPQEVALADVRKGIAMFRKTSVPVLGVVENMTGEIFGRGGGQKAAGQFDVPFLGEIGLDQAIREGGDKGCPVAASSQGTVVKCFETVARSLVEILEKLAVSEGV